MPLGIMQRIAGNCIFDPAFSARLGKRSPLARAPPVQNPTVPFGRPPGTSITRRHRNGGSRRPRGRSIEVARHSIGRTDPLVDHPCHLDDPRRVTHPSAHLVTGGHHGRRLGRPIIDPHMPTSARRGGVRPGLRQPDRPQPPIHTGRLHNIHLGWPTGERVPAQLCGSDRPAQLEVPRILIAKMSVSPCWIPALG
jgi:hypothetical protein